MLVSLLFKRIVQLFNSNSQETTSNNFSSASAKRNTTQILVIKTLHERNIFCDLIRFSKSQQSHSSHPKLATETQK